MLGEDCVPWLPPLGAIWATAVAAHNAHVNMTESVNFFIATLLGSSMN
jgi:hypothetical protein